MEETVPLLVKIDGKTVRIRANINWSVHQLKQHLYLHSNQSVEDLKVVFAGTELSNTVLLKNCHLTHGTVVHAIVVESSIDRGKRSNVTSTNFVAPTQNGIKQTQEHTRRARFYVFCKSTCNGVKPGKLRVRCQICKDEAFEISKGPNSWDDVLMAERINGSCNKANCAGGKAEFFFKCSEHINASDSNEFVALPLRLLRTNMQDVPCLACTDVSDIVLVFPCDDSHVMCLDCFSVYCRTKLDNRQFVLARDIGYTLSCPGGGETCDDRFIKETHHFAIAGKDQYERYKNFATEEFVLQNGGILCPGQGCGNGLLIENNARRVTCHRASGGCGLVFCRDCQQTFHDGQCEQMGNLQATNSDASNGYEVNSRHASRARWRDDVESHETIGRTTKRCPGCRTPTEKSGGCNHMTCARCNHEWCWLCVIEWDRSCQSDHWFRAD